MNQKNNILEEDIPKDRKEDEFDNKDNNKTEFKEIKSFDPDATWLKKGSKSYFGYKSFATTDDESFIDKTKTVPANESEINKLEDMIIEADKFAGDKGYDSKGNREALRS